MDDWIMWLQKFKLAGPDKGSHVSGIVSRRWLFIERTARRRPPLPVWSGPLAKQTKASTTFDSGGPWSCRGSREEAFRVSVTGLEFSGRWFQFKYKRVTHAKWPALWWVTAAATEVFGTRPCFIDLWVFPDSSERRIRTWLSTPV